MPGPEEKTTFPDRRLYRSRRNHLTPAIFVASATITGIALLNACSDEADQSGSGQNGGSATKQLETLQASIEAVSSYIDTGQFGEAGTILSALVEEYPNEPIVLDTYAEFLIHLDRYEEAYETLLHLIEVKGPESASAEVHFNAGTLANTIGRVDNAIEHYLAAVRRDSASPKHPLYLAQMYVKKREYGEANKWLLKVVSLDANIHQAWGTLAEVAYLENELSMARQHLEKARTIEPEFLKWRVLEAKILRREGEPEEAVMRLNALPEGSRWSKSVVEEIAQCYGMMSQPDKAALLHIEYLNRHPGAWESALDAARYYKTAGDMNSARHWAGIADRINPESEEIQRFAASLDG